MLVPWPENPVQTLVPGSTEGSWEVSPPPKALCLPAAGAALWQTHHLVAPEVTNGYTGDHDTAGKEAALIVGNPSLERQGLIPRERRKMDISPFSVCVLGVDSAPGNFFGQVKFKITLHDLFGANAVDLWLC